MTGSSFPLRPPHRGKELPVHRPGGDLHAWAIRFAVSATRSRGVPPRSRPPPSRAPESDHRTNALPMIRRRVAGRIHAVENTAAIVTGLITPSHP
jgi:hypothetical protein